MGVARLFFGSQNTVKKFPKILKKFPKNNQKILKHFSKIFKKFSKICLQFSKKLSKFFKNFLRKLVKINYFRIGFSQGSIFARLDEKRNLREKLGKNFLKKIAKNALF